MIGVLLIFAVLVAVLVVPIATVVAVRVVGRTFDPVRNGSRPIDDTVDIRLARIEEAIDAMAVQIDRLSTERRLPPAREQRAPERSESGEG
jgi:hypothetical protein